MATHWYTAKVISIKDFAAKVKSFELEITDVDRFNFIAGQFITFDLPIGEKRLQRWRSYSIASHPNNTNKIELCIVHFENGLGSGYFFNQVAIGSELKFKGPEGGFVLHEPITQDLVMICTGTGIAPFKSMIYDTLTCKKKHQGIHLIFGTRRVEDILYLDDLLYFEKNISGFRFDIALSREDSISANDHFHKGYVHPIYINNYSMDNKNVKFYICGWSKMIDEAVENLLVKLEVPRENIHYELYG